ncbi:MAG: SemiSWEET transporter [Flavobacteriaceae bacterium]|nr:SemiSWEET transporter [Flavobacteriaceae bacterium]
MDFNVEIIGVLAAIFTTIAYAPQAYKIFKEKSAKEVSLSMYMILLTGLILWLIYGILIDSFAIKLANTVTIALAVSIIYFKIRYK